MSNTQMLEIAQFLLNKEKERIQECKAMIKVGDLEEAQRLVTEADMFDKARELVVSLAKAQIGG